MWTKEKLSFIFSAHIFGAHWLLWLARNGKIVYSLAVVLVILFNWLNGNWMHSMRTMTGNSGRVGGREHFDELDKSILQLRWLCIMQSRETNFNRRWISIRKKPFAHGIAFRLKIGFRVFCLFLLLFHVIHRCKYSHPKVMTRQQIEIDNPIWYIYFPYGFG